MKTSELKKLSNSFNAFISNSEFNSHEQAVSAFWVARFGESNSDREAELLEYWLNS